MIVSDKHKYVFVETPHTGSSAISKELVEKYDGKKVLYKHANYHEFLKIATQKQKKYFVFAGVRNPLEEAISLYNKFLTNHNDIFTDPSKLIKNGGWISERKVEIFRMVRKNKDFAEFVRKYYPGIYTSNININKKDCDYILRFERLEEDFTKVLKKLKVKKKRKLPVVNKTNKKGGFDQYYKGDLIDYAVEAYGPFMKEWGYDFPESWGKRKPSVVSELKYKAVRCARIVYSRFIKGGPLRKLSFIRNAVE